MKKPFTIIAVVIFAVVAIVHGLRLAMSWNVMVAGHPIPMWVSVVGGIVALGLFVMVSYELRATPSAPVSPGNETKSLEQHIRDRAHQLYDRRQRGGGHALDDWMQAEKQIQQESLEQLRALFDYTKFHIGLYSAIAGAAIAALLTKDLCLEVQGLLVLTCLSLAVAGHAGGVIASNIVEYSDVYAFREAHLGFWGMKCFRYRGWASIEHNLFWVGIMSIIAALVLQVWPR